MTWAQTSLAKEPDMMASCLIRTGKDLPAPSMVLLSYSGGCQYEFHTWLNKNAYSSRFWR